MVAAPCVQQVGWAVISRSLGSVCQVVADGLLELAENDESALMSDGGIKVVKRRLVYRHTFQEAPDSPGSGGATQSVC